LSFPRLLFAQSDGGLEQLLENDHFPQEFRCPSLTAKKGMALLRSDGVVPVLLDRRLYATRISQLSRLLVALTGGDRSQERLALLGLCGCGRDRW